MMARIATFRQIVDGPANLAKGLDYIRVLEKHSIVSRVQEEAASEQSDMIRVPKDNWCICRLLQHCDLHWREKVVRNQYYFRSTCFHLIQEGPQCKTHYQ